MAWRTEKARRLTERHGHNQPYPRKAQHWLPFALDEDALDEYENDPVLLTEAMGLNPADAGDLVEQLWFIFDAIEMLKKVMGSGFMRTLWNAGTAKEPNMLTFTSRFELQCWRDAVAERHYDLLLDEDLLTALACQYICNDKGIIRLLPKGDWWAMQMGFHEALLRVARELDLEADETYRVVHGLG